MDSLSKLLLDISVPTQQLQMASIQDILLKIKCFKTEDSNSKNIWNDIAQILWSHLQTGLKNLDDQLLCAISFFTVLLYADNEDKYTEKILKYIDEELIIKRQNESSTETLQVVSLIYGMFQSSYLTQNTDKKSTYFVPLAKSIVRLLILMGYEYTQYTFLVFKIVKLLKKVIGTNFQELIFNTENVKSLLNLVNHNWENPITGVRDLNRSIFQTLLTVIGDVMYEEILHEINGFYWNKAKYLMLSEIIECNRTDVISYDHGNAWVEGLVKSLCKPGLVSAGADLYYALMKKIKTVDEWCNIFLNHIINIFNSSNDKAIENFNNYWCLTTIKKFPILVNNFIEKLKNLNDTEQKLFSMLSVMKQANKLGIIEKKWSSVTDYKEIEHAVLIGIEHCNNYIRMLAFDIVCVSQGKTAPSSTEYDLILNFLMNNVNSDCTVLRLSTLNSFNIFLTQLHSIFLNSIVKSPNDTDIKNLLDFHNKLQDFLIKSVNLNGNYQRKITSVKLCELVMKCSSEIPRKKKAQNRLVNMSLKDFLKSKHVWQFCDKMFVLKLISLLKDPADDVRESVVKLLLNHFSSEIDITLINSLIADALDCMKSKFFYEISCGQSMFKLIANVLLRNKNQHATFLGVEGIFVFAYKELISEYKLNRKIMTTIEMGKQLHSFISILLVILQVCDTNLYQIDISREMVELVETLEGISNQFSWEPDTSTSSDFSKMSDMVQNIIANSGYNVNDESDQTKISGLQQIVLNSLWLNVKASCDMASVLIKFNTKDAVMAEKCLTIITHVLETSRHKGAIEAAGVALGKAIQCLTSLQDDMKASKVPFELLKCKLHDLISETNKMSSITRRGAGLSIMVHRIVSNDMTKGKPLFHYFMNILLDVCNKTEDNPTVRMNTENIENQVDLPKAIYIHFMTRIVTDSSLASDLMYYSAQLAELAFGNLTSPQWQIRNAALQLYGALIPRLIGQKKASGHDDETIATVACDELRTHSPKLWRYITEELCKIETLGDKIQCHSNLVPILNILASTAKRYNFVFDLKEQKRKDDVLLLCLFNLLGSPIHTVRRLAAKCIFNIYEFDTIYNIMLKKECVTENFLHGSLTLLRLCNKLHVSEEQKFCHLKEKVGNVMKSKYHSYLCKELYEDVYLNNFSIKYIEETLSELNNNLQSPGIFLWAETRLRKSVNSCSWREIPDILKKFLKDSEFEKYCNLILFKIEIEHNIPKDVLLEIANILLRFEDRLRSCIIWKILYELSKNDDFSKYINNTLLLNKLDDKKCMYRLRYMIPLIAKNIANDSDENKSRLVTIISNLSDFENSDIDLRYIAALANNELAYHYEYLTDDVRIESIKCAVIMLQDEDEDIRNLCINIYKILSKEKLDVHAYICLTRIINRQFLNTVLSDPDTTIPKFSTKLTEILNSNHTVDEYNPFSNDSKNIYLEPEALKILIDNLNV